MKYISKLFVLVPVGFAVLSFFSGSEVQTILWLILAQLMQIEQAVKS